jgi:activator-of-BECN1-regulated-autophagy protein 1
MPQPEPRDIGELDNVIDLLRERQTGSKRCQCLKEKSLPTRLDEFGERDFLETCEATYASLNPAPRSTIALSYSCDGTLLASSHGDHSVKITDCSSRTLVRILNGHRRTPWVVRFHPKERFILASGSLDHEVRIWNAETGECFRKHTFGKPIASLSFHHQSEVIAIACGHKLYIWEYKRWNSKPEIVLKTRRSMRAVQFHPHGLPVLLTAEVMDPSDTKDLPATMTGSCLDDFDGQRSQPPSMVPLGWEVPFPTSSNSDVAGVQLPDDVQQQATYTSVWNIIGEDQPPRVWIRIWSYNENKSDSYLEDRHRLLQSIPDAVLCSEMGVDFSPCGRYLAATVACRERLGSLETGMVVQEITPGVDVSMDWSPGAPNRRVLGLTRDRQQCLSMPITERVVFEVRMISFDGTDYGKPVRAKRIRAAQCLTSVQFSPTSGHILIGYGKKHSSLLRSLVARQNSLIPVHTILEVVRTSDMTITRVLPSTEDEINAASWHPIPGEGIAYGTKEGKLRFITKGTGGSRVLEE